jgi:hypothetical protein
MTSERVRVAVTVHLSSHREVGDVAEESRERAHRRGGSDEECDEVRGGFAGIREDDRG